MIAREESRSSPERAVDGRPSATTDLPFRIALRDADEEAVEHVVARAHSAALAEAIFRAVREQYPGRYLSLWRGAERLASTED